MMNLGQIIQSHALSFFHLSAPDFLLGWDTPPERRNVFGLIAAEPELARAGIRLRQFGQEVIEHLGGRKIHPASRNCSPGTPFFCKLVRAIMKAKIVVTPKKAVVSDCGSWITSVAGTGTMLSKRIIPCLDVRDGRLTKGIKFKGNIDIGDPVEVARSYYEQGADEIVFYDITASSEGRDIMIDVVKRVAETIFIPFSVGGGIRTLEDMRKVILAGAEKVSVNSGAVENPKIISEGAVAFGCQCVVLGMDVKKVGKSAKIPSGYEIVIQGGRKYMGIDALWWAREAENLGAGEICLNSIDADGTQEGYELELTHLITTNVKIPVIASGGAGRKEDLLDVLTTAKADAALIASIVHYGTYTIAEVKEYLSGNGVKVREVW